MRLANTALDECRRRVQNDTVGHRGRKDDSLYRARRRPVMARERLNAYGHERLMGLLAAGDPHREVWFAWIGSESVRQIYDHTDVELASPGLTRSAATSATRTCRSRSDGWVARSSDGSIRSSPGIERTSRTGPPKRSTAWLSLKRVSAFGFRSFDHYRIRALLYAGRPNWSLLDQFTPP